MAIIPGPDLPGGGHIISEPESIRAIYESGRGSLRVRARWTVEELARGQWRIAVTELPFGVSTRAVLEDIERATNPKPKEGKKSLAQEQVNLKSRDARRARHGARRVRQVARRCASCSSRTRAGRTRPEFMNLLLANTRLESSLPVNLVMLGPRRPAALEEPEADPRRVDRVPLRRPSRGARSTGSAKSTAASTSSKGGSSRCCRSTR